MDGHIPIGAFDHTMEVIEHVTEGTPQATRDVTIPLFLQIWVQIAARYLGPERTAKILREAAIDAGVPLKDLRA